MDVGAWQHRLADLLTEYAVPGVSVAALTGGTVTTVTAGVLNSATGVQVTPDSLFQVGSVSKVYTATVLMRLVERGLVDLDTPVVRVVPGFRLADLGTSDRITLRHLLTHTSGLDGDFFRDTGRGDDCLERYVEACHDLAPAYPLGLTMSYSNVGYSVLGRVIEVLTGATWDRALRDRLLTPLGLTHTHTLPEEAIRYRAALGHERDPDGRLRPATVWGLPRSTGPAGNVTTTATELLAFARLHLDGGTAPDGTRLLREETVACMHAPQVTVPNPWGRGDRWGFGWALFDWDGHVAYGHDGATIGQLAALRVIPEAGVAIAVLANSDQAGALITDVTTGLVRELAGIDVPAAFGPPDRPAAVTPAELDRLTGTYERAAVRFEAELRDGDLVLRMIEFDELSEGPHESEIPLIPLSSTRFAGRSPHTDAWQPFLFQRLADGSECLHVLGRATPKTCGGAAVAPG